MASPGRESNSMLGSAPRFSPRCGQGGEKWVDEAGVALHSASMAVREIGVGGGGIAGTPIAYELAKRGARVTLFERGSLAGEASGRNMGLLLNQIEPGVIRIMQKSLEIYRGLPGGEIDFQLREMPQLVIAADDYQF